MVLAEELRLLRFLGSTWCRDQEEELNYKNIYDQLIADRRLNPPSEAEYVEVHHILPRCMGGTDEPQNLIRLRPEDHFFAHLLLAKIYGGRLWAAVNMMGGVLRSRCRKLPAIDARRSRVRYSKLIRLARDKQRGENHPNSDKTEYFWENIDGRTFVGPRYEFRDKFCVDVKGINNVLAGYAKKVSGWFIPDLLSEDEVERLRSGKAGAVRDKTIYTIRHMDGREFTGKRWQIQEKCGLSRGMAERLVNGGCHTASGWFYPALNPLGLDGKYYTSGERCGTAVQTVFHFRHKRGDEFIGTRMALVERYGLSRSAVHNMAKGVSASSGGWFIVGDDGRALNPANDNQPQLALAI